MSSQTSSNTFIFSNKIDAAFLYEMYENDYPYIETMFKTVLGSFDEDMAAIRDNFRQGNLDSLRRAVHKIKPTFGFAGMPAVQDTCKNFENKCSSAKSITEVEMDFPALIKCLEEAGEIVMGEYQKLKAFNNSSS